MSKITLFPKELTLHHQSEGEILPRLLREHHEGLAFTLGKFLACFGFSLYFLNSLPTPFHSSTPLIFFIYAFFFFFLFFILFHWPLTDKVLMGCSNFPSSLTVMLLLELEPLCCPCSLAAFGYSTAAAFGLMFGVVPSHDAETGTPVPWVSSGSACWSELGWAVCETSLVYAFELSRMGKQLSFLIFIEEWRCPPPLALLQPQKLLAPAGCCVRIISTVLFWRNEADF